MSSGEQWVKVRDEVWRVGGRVPGNDGDLYTLRSVLGGEELQVLASPDEVEVLPSGSPSFFRNQRAPWGVWKNACDRYRPGRDSTVKRSSIRKLSERIFG